MDNYTFNEIKDYIDNIILDNGFNSDFSKSPRQWASVLMSCAERFFIPCDYFKQDADHRKYDPYKVLNNYYIDIFIRISLLYNISPSINYYCYFIGISNTIVKEYIYKLNPMLTSSVKKLDKMQLEFARDTLINSNNPVAVGIAIDKFGLGAEDDIQQSTIDSLEGLHLPSLGCSNN